MGSCIHLAETWSFIVCLAPVVQRLDNAIHWINHYPVDKVNKTNYAIHWIVIYPVDSVIHLLNNQGLMGKFDHRVISSQLSGHHNSLLSGSITYMFI